jgi:hypothetical protein
MITGDLLPCFFLLGFLTKILNTYLIPDRLCGQVVRVPDNRSRSPGFDSLHDQIFWEVVGLERDPLRLVSTSEELLERKK